MGYLSIILAPAHHIDTLNTVVKRVLHVAQSVEQEQVVLTVGEDLYSKLMELKSSVDQYKDILIPCLGGLHIAMMFLGVLGRHMEESGLCELWVECDVLGANAGQNVISGKAMLVQYENTNSYCRHCGIYYSKKFLITSGP